MRPRPVWASEAEAAGSAHDSQTAAACGSGLCGPSSAGVEASPAFVRTWLARGRPMHAHARQRPTLRNQLRESPPDVRKGCRKRQALVFALGSIWRTAGHATYWTSQCQTQRLGSGRALRAENPAVSGKQTCAIMRFMMYLAFACEMTGLAFPAVTSEMQHSSSPERPQACHLRIVTLSRLLNLNVRLAMIQSTWSVHQLCGWVHLSCCVCGSLSLV